MKDLLSCLEYPFDYQFINRKKKSIKKFLLTKENFIFKKVAVLGGSTTSEFISQLDLFLLNYGIKAEFYESSYGRYYEDAIFSDELKKFNPDLIINFVTFKNLENFFLGNDFEMSFKNLTSQIIEIWNNLSNKFHCPIIQNNFELPQYRFNGNSSNYREDGIVRFVNAINSFMTNELKYYNNIYINDLNYLSSLIGLKNWYDNKLWYSYKYAMSFEAITYTSHSVSSIIKGIYGKNKKCLVLDLDNTLWGGVIGDIGKNNIKIGNDTAIGEAYSYFQSYVKKIKELGILLAISSKNEEDIAKDGFSNKDMVLKLEDFVNIKANWNPKSENISKIANELSLGVDSFVFIDDNPAEREEVRFNLENISIPNISKDVDNYIDFIDRQNYFEITNLSVEDINRSKYYSDNLKREIEKNNYKNYADYLKSLNMIIDIKEFEEVYIDRITQLINKTNQFNLTTRRYTKEEIESLYNNKNNILIHSKLKDKFGDNGLISVIIGNIKDKVLEIDLWIMSCRVLKREVELAMFDYLVSLVKNRNIKIINGIYIPTAKNKLVENHYKNLGFDFVSEKDGVTMWTINIENYEIKNKNICLGDY